MHAGDFVVRQRRVGDLAGLEFHLLEQRVADVHDGCAGELRLGDARIDQRAAIGDRDQLGNPHAAGLAVDLDLDAGAADHPIRRDIGGMAGYRHSAAV